MISYEDCLDYIEHNREKITWQDKYFSQPYLPNNGCGNIKLLDCQKKFLKNLINGKVTDCPRNMGKTMVIKLYSEYLNYVADMCKYDSDIVADDYISGDELVDNGLISYRSVKNALYSDKEKAIKAYNISENNLKKYINTNLSEFHIGKSSKK